MVALSTASCGSARLRARAKPTEAFPYLWDQLPPQAQSGPAPRNFEFTGKRIKLKGTGIRCAAMPLQTSGLGADIALLMDDILLAELQKAGFDPIGPDDINAMLGLEAAKDAIGCNDASCIAEIGGALGVDYLVAGRIGLMDGAPIFTVKLLDVRAGRVLGRSNKMGVDSKKELPRLLAEGVQDLVKASGL